MREKKGVEVNIWKAKEKNRKNVGKRKERKGKSRCIQPGSDD